MKTKVKHLQVKLSPTGKVSVRMSRFVNSLFQETNKLYFEIQHDRGVFVRLSNKRQWLYNLMIVAVLERPFQLSRKNAHQDYIRLQLTKAEALAVVIAIAHSSSAYMIELKAEILKAVAI